MMVVQWAFTASGIVLQKVGDETNVQNDFGCIVADSEQSAHDLYLDGMHEKYPVAEGWTRHQVKVSLIGEDALREGLRAYDQAAASRAQGSGEGG